LRRNLPEVRAFARRLVEQAGAEAPERTVVDAGERVLQALGERLSFLVGSAGLHMMFVRALKRAQEDHALLGAVLPAQNGGPLLTGLEEAAEEAGAGRQEVLAAVEAVITELIGLLARLLGAEMAARLVRQSFSDAPLEKAPGFEDSNDDT